MRYLTSKQAREVMARIEKVRELLGLNPSQFARGLMPERGAQAGYLYRNHLPPKSVRPNLDLVLNAVRRWGVNPMWLLFGGENARAFLDQDATFVKADAVRHGSPEAREKALKLLLARSSDEAAIDEGKKKA